MPHAFALPTEMMNNHVSLLFGTLLTWLSPLATCSWAQKVYKGRQNDSKKTQRSTFGYFGQLCMVHMPSTLRQL